MDDDDEMPPDPSPELMLIEAFTLTGHHADGTPFTTTTCPAIIRFGPVAESEA